MIFNRLMIALGVLGGFAIIGLLIMSYVSDNWGPVGVAVVAITLFLTFVFVTVALIFATFGLGMAHIFGKAIGISPLIELLRTMRAGYNVEKNRLTLLDESNEGEKMLTDRSDRDGSDTAAWARMSVPGEYKTLDDEFTMR